MATVVGKETEIRRLYHSGCSVGRIGREVGASTAAVSHKLERMGLRVRSKLKATPGTTRQEIADLYREGVSASEICKKYGVSRWLVLRVARQYGVAVNPRGQRYRQFTASETALMSSMTENGSSQAKIAKELGASTIVVSRAMRAAGIPTTRKRVANGPRHGQWRGGVIKAQGGYLAEHVHPDDPFSSMRNRMGYVLMHRLVMARSLGRALSSTETVHHVNGVRSDNRIENLQLRQGRHGNGVRHVCCDCGSSNVVAAPLS